MPKRWTLQIIGMVIACVWILLIISSGAEARTIEVDIAGSGEFTSIQDGVNASIDGDVVLIHEGEYRESMNISTSITLMGKNSDIVRILNSNHSNSLVLHGKNITIINLIFQGSNSGIVLYSSSGSIIENCTFEKGVSGISIRSSSNNEMMNNTFYNNVYGIFLLPVDIDDMKPGSCANNRIHHNLFTDNENGIFAYFSCSGTEVHNNRFENNTDSAMHCYQVDGTAVNATNNWWGSVWGPYNYEENPHGKGDSVKGPIRYDPWTGKEVIPHPMNLSTAYVLGSALKNGNGSQENPFDSIMDAIYHVQQHGSIHVWEGRYYEHLVIQKSMKIIGNVSEETLIESGAYGDCVIILANHVEIRSIRIRVSTNASHFPHQGIGSLERHSCLKIESSYNIIDNCTFTNGVIGIDLFHSSNNTISSNMLLPHSGGDHEEGIVLQDRSNDNLIVNNTIQDQYYYGISVYSSERNFIMNNICKENRIGIRLSESDSSVLDGNDCSNNDEIGISIKNSSHLRISNNSCNDNGEGGIEIERSEGEGDRSMSNELISNNCSGNLLAGIDLGDSSRSVLRMNSMWGCGIRFGSIPSKVLKDHAIDETNMVNGNPVYYLRNRTGIRLAGGAGQVVLVNCSVIIVENQQFDSCTYGVTLYGCKQVTIANSSFRDNIFGILMNNSDNNQFFNCTLSDNNRDMISGGVAAFYSHNNTIVNCTITGNDLVGLGFVLSSNNSISNNSITENGYGIFYMLNRSLLKTWGLDLPEPEYSYGTNRVHYNTIQRNTYYGISADRIEFNGMFISESDDNSNSVDARFNWWGSDDGPKALESWKNPDGSGDKVSDNVEFSPWLTKEGSLQYAPTKSGDDDGFPDSLHPMDLLVILLLTLAILFASLLLVVRSHDTRMKTGKKN